MNQKFLLTLALIASGAGIAYGQLQCSVQASGDTVICPAQPVPVRAIASPDTVAFRYIWSPGNTVSDSLAANTLAFPSVTTTYTVTAASTDSLNLIANGNFELGNIAFTSFYRDSTSIWHAGTYSITNNPSLVHPAFSPCGDHSSGSGLMMCVNGTGTPNTVVWSQSVNVQPNTDYEFSVWVANILLNPPTLPQLKFSINGKLVGPLISANVQPCQWKELFTIWNSGNTNTAVIEIINVSTFQTGNDFALDDIAFRAICKTTAQVVVTVRDTLDLNVYGITTPDTILCDGASVFINVVYPDAISFNWTDGVSGSFRTVSTADVYTVSMLDVCGRTIQDQVVITTGTAPQPSLPTDTTVCEGTVVVFDAYHPNVVSYFWRGSSAYFGQNDPYDTTFTAVKAGVYEVELTNECGTVSQSIELITENCACKVFIPSGFTPNKDGKNDELRIYAGCDIQNVQFSVFDRWGALLFTTTDPTQAWEGTLTDGSPAPLGVYVWTISYDSADTSGDIVSRTEHGDTLLIR